MDRLTYAQHIKERYETADPDLVQLSMAHSYDIVMQRNNRNIIGILFHCDNIDSIIQIYIDDLEVSKVKFMYFNLLQPHHHAYLVPCDKTLGCYFIAFNPELPIAFEGMVQVKADDQIIPFKWIVKHDNPICISFRRNTPQCLYELALRRDTTPNEYVAFVPDSLPME
jgi:hypothetical protein